MIIAGYIFSVIGSIALLFQLQPLCVLIDIDNESIFVEEINGCAFIRSFLHWIPVAVGND
ncbi:MAG: hypothetical protein ABW007_16545 [Chitinophagaceae bacterium]